MSASGPFCLTISCKSKIRHNSIASHWMCLNPLDQRSTSIHIDSNSKYLLCSSSREALLLFQPSPLELVGVQVTIFRLTGIILTVTPSWQREKSVSSSSSLAFAKYWPIPQLYHEFRLCICHYMIVGVLLSSKFSGFHLFSSHGNVKFTKVMLSDSIIFHNEWWMEMLSGLCYCTMWKKIPSILDNSYV